jgi:hypothetical protein
MGEPGEPGEPFSFASGHRASGDGPLEATVRASSVTDRQQEQGICDEGRE